MHKKAEEITAFIVDAISNGHPHPALEAQLRFGINRRTVHDYIQRLIKQGVVIAEGRTKARRYQLKTLVQKHWNLPVTSELEEHIVWERTIEALVHELPFNIQQICNYGVVEMVNNVKDHSESPDLQVAFLRDAASINIVIRDHGVGVFEKIRAALKLEDPREALLELSKGKLTTAPAAHSGEGIYFTSRMFDRFVIDSGGLLYMAKASEEEDWIFEMKEAAKSEGTRVMMVLSTAAKRTPQEVFDKYAGTAGFFRSHVPLSLARYGGQNLVSRSQARRVLARFDKFEHLKEVLLDFEGVAYIGQPFADEIFRVFANQHPEITVVYRGASPEIERMIAWVKGEAKGQGPLPL